MKTGVTKDKTNTDEDNNNYCTSEQGINIIISTQNIHYMINGVIYIYINKIFI